MDDSKPGDKGGGRARRLLGEVLTIVVGILLALSPDQWVECRTERGIGTEYLERIERDLVADSAGMANDISRLGHQMAALDTILTEFAGPEARRNSPVRFAAMPDGILRVTRRGHLNAPERVESGAPARRRRPTSEHANGPAHPLAQRPQPDAGPRRPRPSQRAAPARGARRA